MDDVCLEKKQHLWAVVAMLKDNPLLLLFLVSAVGYWLGTISIRGTKLGVAAVLFAGLAFGALDPGLKVPEIVIVLGLSIFVYTIGLSSGPGFFSTFQRQGLRDVSFVGITLFISAMLAIAMHLLFGFDAATTAGLLSGSSTNTPSLAGLLDLIDQTAPAERRESTGNSAVIGYSLSYPMGVLGTMLAINVLQRIFRVDYRREERSLEDQFPGREGLSRLSVKITNPAAEETELRHWFQKFNGRLVFGRMERDDQAFLPNMDTRLRVNDRIVLVGNQELLEQAATVLGEALDTELTYDRTVYDMKRIFVSNPRIAGQKIASLNLPEKFSTIITRVQRGDIEMIATGETTLELGDRVLIIARRHDLPALSKFFGNSYESLSHINLLSFGSGMALGLLLGMVTFALPGGFSFRLGFAGGPIIIALILGALRRTGPIVWSLPYSANLTLRQFGLILMLAGIGVRSGHTFLQTILQGGGTTLFLAGTLIATLTAILSLIIGYRLFRIPFSLLTGMVAIQPAVLEHALEKSGNKLPTIGFSMVLPVTLIAKILFVQLLYAILS